MAEIVLENRMGERCVYALGAADDHWALADKAWERVLDGNARAVEVRTTQVSQGQADLHWRVRSRRT